MNINNIVNLNGVSKIQKSLTPRAKINTGLQKDTFEKVSFKGSIDVDSAIKELKEMKNYKGTPKFSDDKIEIIKNEITKTPEKWEPFRELIQNPKILGGMACDIIVKDLDVVKGVSDLSQIKKDNNTPRFSPFDIKALANNLSKVQEFDKAKVLAESGLGIDDLMQLSKNPKLKHPEKVVQNYNKMKERCGDKLLLLSFKTDDYDPNAFALVADLRNSSKRIELFDSNMKKISSEEVVPLKSDSGREFQLKKTIDRRNHTVSKVKLEVVKNMPQPILVNEVRIIKDKDGNVQRKEFTNQSPVAGVLNIKHVFPDGTVKDISSGSIDAKTGITTVKKDMTSLDGTRTQYLYENDPNGNVISDYVITDKDGNILLKNSQSFEVLSDNKFISSKNGQDYEITVNEKNIDIKDLKSSEVSTLNFENYINGNKEKIINVLKKMSGEELIALSKTVKQLDGIDNINYSTFGVLDKTIKTGDNLFVMLHELGHAKDYNEVNVKEKETIEKSIFSNKKVNEVFEQEKARFNEAFPVAQREHINYFIKTSEYKDGLQETIAETNALLNTYNNEDLFSIRSQYLQQYFPRTIAEISKLLSKQ